MFSSFLLECRCYGGGAGKERLNFRRRLALGVGVMVREKVVLGEAISPSAFRNGLGHVSFLDAQNQPLDLLMS